MEQTDALLRRSRLSYSCLLNGHLSLVSPLQQEEREGVRGGGEGGKVGKGIT